MPGIKEILWTDDCYSPQALVRAYSKSFPVIVHVTKGYFGTNEIETISTDQVARVHDYVSQTRVLAEDISGEMLSIPLDYPVKLLVREAKKNKRVRPKSLREIIRQYNLPVNAYFDIGGSGKGSVKFGYKEIKTAKYGEITILGVKVVTFLLTNTIHDGVIDRMVSLLPTYLDYDMRVARGLKEGDDHEWVNLSTMYARAVSHINYRSIRGVSDIMVVTQPFTPTPQRKESDFVEGETTVEGEARVRINGVVGGIGVTDFTTIDSTTKGLQQDSLQLHRSTVHVISDVNTDDNNVTSGLGSDVSSLSLPDSKNRYGRPFTYGPPNYQSVPLNQESSNRNQVFKTTVDLSPGSPPPLVPVGSGVQGPYFTAVPTLKRSSSADNVNILFDHYPSNDVALPYARGRPDNRQVVGDLLQPMRTSTMPRYGMVTMYEDGQRNIHYSTLGSRPSNRLSRSLTDLRVDVYPEVYSNTQDGNIPLQYSPPHQQQARYSSYDGRYRKAGNPSRTMSTSSASRRVRMAPSKQQQYLDVPDGGVHRYQDFSDEEHYSFGREQKIQVQRQRRNHPVLSSPNPSRRNKSSSSYSEPAEVPPQYSVVDTETGRVSYQVDPGYIERQVRRATMEAGRKGDSRGRRMESVESFDTMDSYDPASQNGYNVATSTFGKGSQGERQRVRTLTDGYLDLTSSSFEFDTGSLNDEIVIADDQFKYDRPAPRMSKQHTRNGPARNVVIKQETRQSRPEREPGHRRSNNVQKREYREMQSNRINGHQGKGNRKGDNRSRDPTRPSRQQEYQYKESHHYENRHRTKPVHQTREIHIVDDTRNRHQQPKRSTRNYEHSRQIPYQSESKSTSEESSSDVEDLQDIDQYSEYVTESHQSRSAPRREAIDEEYDNISTSGRIVRDIPIVEMFEDTVDGQTSQPSRKQHVQNVRRREVTSTSYAPRLKETHLVSNRGYDAYDDLISRPYVPKTSGKRSVIIQRVEGPPRSSYSSYSSRNPESTLEKTSRYTMRSPTPTMSPLPSYGPYEAVMGLPRPVKEVPWESSENVQKLIETGGHEVRDIPITESRDGQQVSLMTSQVTETRVSSHRPPVDVTVRSNHVKRKSSSSSTSGTSDGDPTGIYEFDVENERGNARREDANGPSKSEVRERKIAGGEYILRKKTAEDLVKRKSGVRTEGARDKKLDDIPDGSSQQQRRSITAAPTSSNRSSVTSYNVSLTVARSPPTSPGSGEDNAFFGARANSNDQQSSEKRSSYTVTETKTSHHFGGANLGSIDPYTTQTTSGMVPGVRSSQVNEDELYKFEKPPENVTPYAAVESDDDDAEFHLRPGKLKRSDSMTSFKSLREAYAEMRKTPPSSMRVKSGMSVAPASDLFSEALNLPPEMRKKNSDDDPVGTHVTRISTIEVTSNDVTPNGDQTTTDLSKSAGKSTAIGSKHESSVNRSSFQSNRRSVKDEPITISDVSLQEVQDYPLENIRDSIRSIHELDEFLKTQADPETQSQSSAHLEHFNFTLHDIDTAL